MKYTTPDMELVMFQVIDDITTEIDSDKNKPADIVDEIIEDIDNI